jgi:ribose transport system ATP-binding protein
MITLADRILVMRDFALAGEVRNDHVYANTSQSVIRLVHAETAA